MNSRFLEVREPGEVTIIGFREERFLGGQLVKTCQREVAEIIDTHRPQVLQFDLTGVVLVTSVMLNFLISLQRQGLDIVLYNPSEDVRAALEATRLDTLLELREAEED